jgi:type IV secretion system protein VirD4
MPSNIAFIISMVSVIFIVIIMILQAKQGSLNIKSKTVGDGQYGDARLATQKEINDTYRVIPFEPEKWRMGMNLPTSVEFCAVLGYLGTKKHTSARIDTSDSNTILISPPGAGKTTCILYPNLELACASGMSFLVTDTKGDAFRDYAGIAQKYYHYRPYVIDLRNPTRSNGFNLLHLVNKYMDKYKASGSLKDKARAERYAKITAHTIVHMDGFDGGGQNAFFYEAAEGLIASTILLVSEFCAKGERHIVSVFKIIQELLQTKAVKSKADKSVKPKNEYQKLMELLPPEHKAKWLAGAALNTAESSMHSVMSTAMSRLLSFIDSELEQILCFDSYVDAEQFCNDKVAVFIVFPEEDPTKFFLVNLFVSELYNECLTIANQDGKNKLDRRILFYLDEIGTMPKFDNLDQMFTAGRSRNILFFPMLQSVAQFDKKYGRDGTNIILEACQNALVGGQAPLSKSASDFSDMLGKMTVQAGGVSYNGNGLLQTSSSQNYHMVSKPLISANKLKTLPKNQWVLMKTHNHPFITTLKRYNEWGIELNCPYEMPEFAARPVRYASKDELWAAVLAQYPQKREPEPEEIPLPEEPPVVRKTHISDELI